MSTHYSALHVCTITGMVLGVIYLFENWVRMRLEERKGRLIR